MSLRDWFADRKKSKLVNAERIRREMPDGLWTKCPKCTQALYNKELESNLQVCLNCSHHFRIGARQRIEQLADPGTFGEKFSELQSVDPLNFTDTKPYILRIKESYARLGPGDGVITGVCQLAGIEIALAVMDFSFMGGSMGAVVGEKITRTIESANQQHRPLIIVTASGGARMQEGTISLLQMAKTAAVLARFHDNGGLYLTVLTDPTTGGVSASFAFLADIIIAEPGAIIGFAGRRVIEQTIRQKVPAEFQTAQWLLDHGNIDLIVPRTKLRATLGQLLHLHSRRPA